MRRSTIATLFGATFVFAMMSAESFAQSSKDSHTKMKPSLAPSSAGAFKQSRTATPAPLEQQKDKAKAVGHHTPVPKQKNKAQAVGYFAPVEGATDKAKAVGHHTPVSKQKDKAKAVGTVSSVAGQDKTKGVGHFTCLAACMKETNASGVSINQGYLKQLCAKNCKQGPQH